MQSNVTLVWKVIRRREVPWVIVAPSAVLHINREYREREGTLKERKDKDAGMGLYAWRKFEREECIGMYSGKEYGPFDPEDTDAIAAVLLSLPPEERGKMKSARVCGARSGTNSGFMG